MEGQYILLVEDNPDDEMMTVRSLRKSGIKNEILVARDGVEALDILLARGPKGSDKPRPGLPAIVLLDLKLPKVDGLDVLREIRSRDATRLLPVVVLTSSTEEQDILRSYDLGANSYVRKPVDFKEFAEAVRQLGLYWILLNLGPPSKDHRP